MGKRGLLSIKKENQIHGSLVANIIKYTLFSPKNQALLAPDFWAFMASPPLLLTFPLTSSQLF